MHHAFETPAPTHLHVEMGAGSLEVTTTDAPRTHIEITGDRAEEFHVTQDGDQITVLAPRRRAGFFGGNDRATVMVSLPIASDASLRTGSAPVTVDGSLGRCHIKSGSGAVRVAEATGAAVVETGSGDITVRTAGADLRLKAGSADVEVGTVAGPFGCSVGSGNVRVGTAGATVVAKAGSGDLLVDVAHGDVQATTGSGDIEVAALQRGRFIAKSASGDVALGIPSGTPVWTDVSSVTGRVRSDLTPVGEPAEGQDHIEARITTVSGDVTLHQI